MRGGGDSAEALGVAAEALGMEVEALGVRKEAETSPRRRLGGSLECEERLGKNPWRRQSRGEAEKGQVREGGGRVRERHWVESGGGSAGSSRREAVLGRVGERRRLELLTKSKERWRRKGRRGAVSFLPIQSAIEKEHFLF